MLVSGMGTAADGVDAAASSSKGGPKMEGVDEAGGPRGNMELCSG